MGCGRGGKGSAACRFCPAGAVEGENAQDREAGFEGGEGHKNLLIPKSLRQNYIIDFKIKNRIRNFDPNCSPDYNSLYLMRITSIIMSDLASKIKSIRKAKGFSQKEVALTIGVDQAQYSRIESGKVEPTLASLRKIATALEVRLADFFSEEQPIDVNSIDKSLTERLRLIDELEEEEKRSIFAIMDMAISKKRLTDALSSALNLAS